MLNVTDIQWVLDSKVKPEFLPTEIELPDWIEADDDYMINTYLYEKTGFHNKGYALIERDKSLAAAEPEGCTSAELKSKKSASEEIYEVFEKYLNEKHVEITSKEKENLILSVKKVLDNRACDIKAGSYCWFDGVARIDEQGNLFIESDAIEEYIHEYSME